MPDLHRAVLALTCAACLAVAAAGCKGGEAEQQISDLTAKQREVIDVPKAVTDKESAKAANTKLKTLAGEFGAVLERMKTTKVSKSENDRLQAKFKSQQDQLTKDMQAETQRIGKIPGAGPELLEGLKAIGAAAQKAKM